MKPDASRRVYDELFALADAVLAAGRSVVLDAVFLSAEERARAEALGRRHGAPLSGVWMEADPATLRRRLAARSGDASDADAAVLETQLALGAGLVSWAPLRTQGEIDKALTDLANG